MTELPNAPLSFRWYDALFNTARFQRYIANVADMEAHIHQLRAQAIKDNRELDKRAEQLDECRNRIAILTGAATEQNTPYQVRGKHAGATSSRPMDRPFDAVRSGDFACDSNRRRRDDDSRTGYHESMSSQPDNSALLAVAAVVLMSDDVQAAPEPEIPAQAVPCAPAWREPETPAYVAPEPQRESYTPPSRSDSYESPSRNDSYESPSSSSDNSSPSCD